MAQISNYMLIDFFVIPFFAVLKPVHRHLIYKPMDS